MEHEIDCPEITLPEFEGLWKWPRLQNIHLSEEIVEETLSWSASFAAFDRKTQELVDKKGKLSLLAALAYSRMDRDELRTGCELMHMFFVLDEYSDRATPEEIVRQSDAFLEAILHPEKPRPEGEWVGGEFARQWWLRFPKTTTEAFRRHFRAAWTDFAAAFIKEVQYRDEQRILDLDEYLVLRRYTSGAYPTIIIHEIPCDIPDDIRYHPVISELEMLAVDLITIANDVLSYNKEQVLGDDHHNLVTILMHKYQVGVQDAINIGGELFNTKMERFNELYPQVPRFGGPIDLDVHKLVDGMGQTLSGILYWTFESERYFGTRGVEIQKSRKMRLLPKIDMSEVPVGPVPLNDALIA